MKVLFFWTSPESTILCVYLALSGSSCHWFRTWQLCIFIYVQLVVCNWKLWLKCFKCNISDFLCVCEFPYRDFFNLHLMLSDILFVIVLNKTPNNTMAVENIYDERMESLFSGSWILFFFNVCPLRISYGVDNKNNYFTYDFLSSNLC